MTGLAFGGAFLWPGPYIRESHRVLHAAYEYGFRHFDVAPSYGHGWAESVLGSARLPHDAKFTTKTGLFPDATSRGKGLAIAVARRLGVQPHGRTTAQGRSSPRFDVRVMDRFLIKSCKALGRDAVDILLLHEARGEGVSPEVFEWLVRRKEQGALRTYGAGSQLSDLQLLSKHHQLPVWQYTVKEMFDAGGSSPADRRKHITHGVFSTFKDFVKERICERADTDPQDHQAVTRLCVAAALETNAHGLVLVATRKLDHIRLAAEVFSDTRLRACAASALRSLLRA